MNQINRETRLLHSTATVLALLLYVIILSGCTLTYQPELLDRVSPRERAEWLQFQSHQESPKVVQAIQQGRVEVGMSVEHAYMAWADHVPLRVRQGQSNTHFEVHEFRTRGPGKPLRTITVRDGVVVQYEF